MATETVHPCRWADHRRRDSLAARWRRARFERFRRLMETMPRPMRILDVGGTAAFWTSMGVLPSDDLRITLLNIEPDASDSEAGFKSVKGDARALSMFADRSFDVVFSNSVLEHVGAYDDQRRMAEGIRRVGRRYFVQTPNRAFPIEPHFHFPFFAQLPEGVRIWLVRHFALGWFPRTPDRATAAQIVRSVCLLTRDRLEMLFPGARIESERVAGLTTSFVAMGECDGKREKEWRQS